MKKIVYIEVGNLSKIGAEKYIKETKEKIKTESPEFAKDVVFYVPMKDGLPSIRVETIPDAWD